MGKLMHRCHGRVIVAGAGRGRALVTGVPLSLWGGLDPTTGEIIDRRHPLSGECVIGRVLVLPGGRGSCSASGVLFEAIRNGTAPAAIVTTTPDPIIALGAILGDELYARPVPVVLLTPGEAARIWPGDEVAVAEDGTVEIRGAAAADRGGPPCPP